MTMPHPGRKPLIIGSPRVDFEETRIAGNWGTCAFFDEIDPEAPDSFAVDAAGLTPEQLADIAAEWLHSQLIRPIERHEWLREGSVYDCRWVLADSGRIIAGGELHIDRGAPDLIKPIRPNIATGSN
jgi:hypothetical protein